MPPIDLKPLKFTHMPSHLLEFVETMDKAMEEPLRLDEKRVS
jgi:hypothetical protein